MLVRFRINRLLLAIVLLVSLPSCIRYVAPQSELKESGKSEYVQLAGPEAFHTYEQQLKDRLTAALQSRQGLLTNTTGDYLLGPGDSFDFSVFGFSDLTQKDVQVANSGTVSLPLIGDNVPVSGLSVSQARDELTKKLRKYIVDPKIIIQVKGYASNSVAVTGEVAKPGLYPLARSGMLLNELIASAGGTSERASNRVIIVPRSSGTTLPTAPQPGSQQVASNGSIEISLEELFGTGNTQPVLFPVRAGDTIIVPEQGTFEVDGEVDKPGSFPITKRTSVFGAIAAAGGFTYSAKVDEVEVIRDIGSGKKAVVTLNLEEVAVLGKQDIPLRDGDIIRVPSASGKHFQRQSHILIEEVCSQMFLA